jgi:DNA uptake protein ComE-like DNA-binding protein
MPTPGERKALLFLAGVALLGGAVRLVGAGAERPLPAEDLTGLDAQLAAADSASARDREARNARAGGKGRSRRAKAPRRERRVGDATHDAPAPPATPPVPLPSPVTPLDLDRATVEEIDVLPGVGPSLARRIVAWRDSSGGLGALEALDCVPGVGPALLRRVGPHVTFSAGRRPSCVGSPAPAGRRTRRPR